MHDAHSYAIQVIRVVQFSKECTKYSNHSNALYISSLDTKHSVLLHALKTQNLHVPILHLIYLADGTEAPTCPTQTHSGLMGRLSLAGLVYLYRKHS